MKKHFSYKTGILMILITGIILSSCSEKKPSVSREYYQLLIYKLNDESQEMRMDIFLKDAYIPAVRRAGIERIGVFKPVESDAGAENMIIVLLPFKSLLQFETLPGLLQNDMVFQKAGKDYLDAGHENPPYQRIESILMKAFENMPAHNIHTYSTLPGERIYELRSYEAPTEKLFRRKVEMFNSGGEMKLFERLGFNAVFYGEVISGASMPNLMYMTTFSDMNSRDEHWNTFRNHPEWKDMLDIDKYKNTVSKSFIYLLHPAEYSGI